MLDINDSCLQDIYTFINRTARQFTNDTINPYVSIRIASHNINGILTSSQKLDALLTWASNKHINLLAIQETNIDSSRGAYLLSDTHKQHFYTFWSNKDPDKNKGSGIGLIVDNIWSKYHTTQNNHSLYLMQNVFIFKGISIYIWVCYLPPDNTEVRQELIDMVQQIDLADNRNMHIWIGDSNYVINQDLDKSNSNASSKSHRDFITSLMNQGFCDAFRFFNSHAEQYSYTKIISHYNNDTSEPSVTKTRIDHIWIPFNCIQHIESFNHEKAHAITESDHTILNLKLNMADIIRNAYKHTRAISTTRPFFRQIEINLGKSIKSNRNNFTKILEALMTDYNPTWDINIKDLLSKQDNKDKQQTLDLIWNDLIALILTAANSTLTLIKHFINPILSHKKNPELAALDKSCSRTSELRYLLHSITHDHLQLTTDLKIHWRNLILRFNKDFSDDLNTKFYSSLSMNKEEWIINLQRIIRYRTKLNDTKYKQFNLKQIETNIEKRMSYISTEESKFLDSVLNRHTSPIIIDRLKVEDDDGFCTLLLDPDDIKNQAAASYQHQFRKRTHKLDTIDNFWKRIYSPMDTQNDTYHPLNSDISEQDWHDTLQLLNMKSVSRTSGVPYELFTHLPLSFVNHILRIYNYVL
ncbi:unnamed protein product [Rhizophagus irregularis]|nr:unnamed protein product [Rhizophagus irregularis]